MGRAVSNVIVTGASCMIARELVGKLLGKGDEVVGIIHDPKNSLHIQNPKYCELALSMEEYGNALRVFEDADCIFHFAWNGTRGKARDDEALQMRNYHASMTLLDHVVRSGWGGVRKFFLAGSQAEYGKPSDSGAPVDEKVEPHPLTAYGKAKFKLLHDGLARCTSDLILIEPRFFSTYGFHDRGDTLLSYAIPRLLKGERCEFGMCLQSWNFIHASDSAEALVALMESDVSSGSYNVASDDTRPLKEYLLEMKDVFNSTSELVFGAVDQDENSIMELNPCIEKIQSDTGWAPKIRFAEGIKSLVDSGAYKG